MSTGAPLRVTETTDIGEILAFQRKIYADDPVAVAPLDAWVRRRVAPTNPFFREAELHFYVARRGDEVVGTISALRDRRHEELRGEKAAFFGFFECVDDAEVAGVLFDRASETARGWGATVLRGPRNLTRVEEVGITVEGHDIPPPMLASHCPRYYQALVEGAGFEKHHDVLAWDIELNDAQGQPRPLPEGLVTKADGVNLPGLELRGARPLAVKRDLEVSHAVFVEAFRDVPENTPMPREQFVNLGRAFIAVSDRRMLQIATVNGEAAGFALCFPELNEAIRAAQGQVWPFGWAKVLAAMPRIRTASFKLIGVLPQHRHSGLHALLIRRVVEGVRAAGYTRIEGSLIDERNKPMCRTVESVGMRVYRRYRLYDRAL